jgi:hypothetical protein
MEHNVLETGSGPVVEIGLSNELNSVCPSQPSDLRTQTDPVSKILCEYQRDVF